MKKIICSLTILLFISAGSAFAQGPVEYMDAISKENQAITEQFIAYTSTVAHGKSARKVEKNRKELLKLVDQALSKAKKLSAYNGDNTLKEATVQYLDLTQKALNEDYAKIVDMEEIAEQSYDNMEAYLLAQEKVSEKMKEASDNLSNVQKTFAATHNVTLIESETETSQKMKKIGETNKYYREVFLIFFRSTKQQAYLMDAMARKDVNGIEQNRSTLEKYAAEGLQKLEGIKAFNGDMSIVNSARKMLQFHQELVKHHIPVITEYTMKSEKFEEKRKALEGNANRTKEEVDAYNKAAAEMNKENEKYNKTINDLNNKSGQTTDDWNNSVKNFFDKHMPHRK